MLYGDRDAMRRFFVETHARRRSGQVLTPTEALIADVIDEHPEYHELLQAGRIDDDYTAEQGRMNPFLHLGMHIAIREQVGIDRPQGIRAAWQALAARDGGAHTAEHRMLDCLAEALAAAQRSGQPPDDQAYLESVLKL